MTGPVIVNQLGPEVSAALAAHPLRPRVRDAEPGPGAWQDWEPEVLLVGPHPAWRDAASARPPGWPRGLRWVQSASTGIDWLPRWLLDGPVVTCGRGHNAVPIAEYVLGAILLHEKRLDAVSIRARADWRRHALGTLEGQVLGLAGYGAIGRAVAVRAQAFGMQVVAWKRSPWNENAPGVRPVDGLSELVAQSDHLLLALPLTDATHHCVDAALLAQAKPGLHLVNVARGGLVDQPALLAALDSGTVGFATLDVTDPEPLPDGHPIYAHPRIRLTPHISWSGLPPGTSQTTRLTAQILDNLDRYARGNTLRDVVDPARGY